jgi:tetrapyrrole methylase family protein/MazG family protein
MHSFNDFRTVVHKIRNQCPWDKEQDHSTLKKYLIEESYEVLEAIDEGDFAELEIELGDVLLQIMLHSEIASETDKFNIDGVVDKITAKMIERHPHVFGDDDANISSDKVLENWEVIKSRTLNRKSVLEGVPRHLPALMRAQRLQAKAAGVGFDWPHISDVLEKTHEELTEFLAELESGNQKAQAEEFGDLLFALVNVGRHLKFDVEDCLQQASQKFIRRFNYVEDQFENHADMRTKSLDELDKHWDNAKKKGL